MSRVCDVCGKKPLTGNHRSHAMNATKRKFFPNLHKMKVDVDGKVKKMNVCSSCLRGNKVKKVV